MAWRGNISEEMLTRVIGWLPQPINVGSVPRPRLQTVPDFMQTCQLEFSLHRRPESFLIPVGFETTADRLSLSLLFLFYIVAVVVIVYAASQCVWKREGVSISVQVENML